MYALYVGGLAQLVRALCLHRSCHVFESHIPHHFAGDTIMRYIQYYERILVSLALVGAGVYLKLNDFNTCGNTLLTFGVIRAFW